jgi:AAA15 family ATPase/GTPase
MTDSNNFVSEQLDLANWKFKAQNLGCLQSEAQLIEFKPLTIVCGQNNTGKTWSLYALYGFLSDGGYFSLPGIKGLVEHLHKDGQHVWNFSAWLEDNVKRLISEINISKSRRLYSIFNSDPELFENTRFDWQVTPEEFIQSAIARPLDYKLEIGRDKRETLRIIKNSNSTEINFTILSEQFPDLEYFISSVIAGHLIGNPLGRNVFLVPAERNGLHLFYRELANKRAALLHHASRKDKDIDIGQLIQDVAKSRYAKPIADYIDWLNDLPDIKKKKKGHFHNLAESIKGLVGGKYEIDNEGEITFTPRKLKKGDPSIPPKLDLHLTSSTVKSLFGLWAYLEFDAKPGDVLMIDEPELNLHPSNQRKLARILAKLANNNLRVVISTHSDYLVREINSLIMLSKDSPQKVSIMRKFDYVDDETLNPDSVAAWLFAERSIKKMEISLEEGIYAQTFDDEINLLNDTSNEIYYAFNSDAEND